MWSVLVSRALSDLRHGFLPPSTALEVCTCILRGGRSSAASVAPIAAGEAVATSSCRAATAPSSAAIDERAFTSHYAALLPVATPDQAVLLLACGDWWARVGCPHPELLAAALRRANGARLSLTTGQLAVCVRVALCRDVALYNSTAAAEELATRLEALDAASAPPLSSSSSSVTSNQHHGHGGIDAETCAALAALLPLAGVPSKLRTAALQAIDAALPHLGAAELNIVRDVSADWWSCVARRNASAEYVHACDGHQLELALALELAASASASWSASSSLSASLSELSPAAVRCKRQRLFSAQLQAAIEDLEDAVVPSSSSTSSSSADSAARRVAALRSALARMVLDAPLISVGGVTLVARAMIAIALSHRRAPMSPGERQQLLPAMQSLGCLSSKLGGVAEARRVVALLPDAMDMLWKEP